jgi:hypothetical protein
MQKSRNDNGIVSVRLMIAMLASMKLPILTKPQVQSFQALAKSKYQLELSYSEAEELATNLFHSFILLTHARRNLRPEVIRK